MAKERSQLSTAPTADKTTAHQRYIEVINRDFRRNAACFISFDFIWGLGTPFAMLSTLMPAYMTELGAPKIIIGVMLSLFMTLCPLQILAGHYFRNRPRKKWLICTWMGCLVPWLLYNIVFFFNGQIVSNTLQLTLFCICVAVFIACISGNHALQFSLITNCIPIRKRGSIFGYRMTALAIGTLAMSPVFLWVMNHWPEPNNFLVSFAIGNIFYMLCSVCMFPVREHRDPATFGDRRPNSKINRLLPRTRLILRKMMRTPNYRVFLSFIIIFSISRIMGSFIIVFAKETLNLTGAQILPFTIIHFAASAAFAVILGKFADRIGYKMIGVIEGIVLTCGFLLVTFVAMSPKIYPPLIYVGFFLYVTATYVIPMVMLNMSVELLPRQNKAALAASANTLKMPFILIASPLTGLIIDISGSYCMVFAIAALLAAISTVGFALWVREPRTKHIAPIKNFRRL